MAIVITSKQDKFRRCGIAHPAQPTTYPNDKFTRAELKILKTEPMLVVQEVPDEPEANGEGKKGKAKTKE